MKELSIPKCLMQSSLQLRPGDIVEEYSDGCTNFYVKDSEFKFTIYRTEHNEKKRYMFLGMEKIPDVSSISGRSGDTVWLTGLNRINANILASKWLSIELNKVIYKYWSNGNCSPGEYFKIITER